jgi:branched-chain amino acid transport system substrate-binding protein
MTRARVGITAGLAAGAVLLAACSSSGNSKNDSSSGNTGGTGSTGTTSNSGGTAGAKGTIKVGWINSEGSTTGASYPQGTTAAEAAVQYVNNDLGGINGYKLVLNTCKSNETPAQTTLCATKAVADKPVVVALGTVGDDQDILSVTKKADIPFYANSAFTTDTLGAGAPAAYVIDSSGTGGMLTIAKALQTSGAKNIAIIYVNVPGSQGTLKTTASGYVKAGLTVKSYPVPYPSPDLTSTFSAIGGTKPDAVVLLADPITCTAGLNAATAVGFDKPIYGVGSCVTPDFGIKSKALSKGGVFVTTTSVPVTDTSDADVKAYTAAMGKYAASYKQLDNVQAVNGFQTIMNLYTVLKKATDGGAAPSSQGFVDAMKSGPFHQFMLGASTTFNCNGTALKAAASLCSLSGVINEYKDGVVSDPKPINPTDLTT